MDGRYPEYPVRIHFGRMDTPDQEARAKRLHGYLSDLVKHWDFIRPAAKFKMIQDQYGQVQVLMDDRMLTYILMRFAEYEPDEVIIPEGQPPEWFMLLGKDK